MTLTSPDMTVTTAAPWGEAELQSRELVVDVVDAGDADERVVAGIGVPFGEPIELWWGREQFAADCQFDDLDRARLFYRHGELIGTLVRSEATDAGLRVELKISRTPRGDEAYTLLRDGALDRFSIGFRPVEWLTDDEGLVTHTRVQVREFSLVPHPAYPGAIVDEVRHDAHPRTTLHHHHHREDTMPPETLTRDELDTALGDQRRELEQLMQRALEQHTAGRPVLGEQYRSAGEFLKAIATGDQAAHELHRAFAGGVFADTASPATWIADAINLVAERRRTLNSFQTAPLPAEGMTLEFAQLDTDGLVVAEQTAEGEPLAFGKLTLTSDTVPVDTFGGYTTVGLQTAQRASTSYLTTVLQAMDLAYARSTEAAVKAFLVALRTAQITAGNRLILPDLSAATVFDWLDLIVDAAELAETRGFGMTGLKVGKDVFKALYRLSANGEPLLEVKSGQGTNKVGTLRASELAADLADVRVELVTGAPALFATFYDSVAITTWEQPGAPVQLQQDSVINLDRAFSKYGNIAIGSQYPGALVPVSITAA